MVVERLLPVLLPAATFEIGFKRGFEFFPETGTLVISMLAVRFNLFIRAGAGCDAVAANGLGLVPATGALVVSMIAVPVKHVRRTRLHWFGRTDTTGDCR